jgi:hypothetical protein
MNTIQIYQELKKDHYANKIFKSVYIQLPHKFRKPCAFVVNTHKSNQPGQHWLAFYLIMEVVNFLTHYTQVDTTLMTTF